MNWDAIGAIGEVLGAIGVIATLAYLAVQIRQNSEVVRASTRQAISTTQLQVGFQIASSPELRDVTARWRSGTPPATPDEALAEEMFLRANFRAFENQYHQHRHGTFDDALWRGYRENMKQVGVCPRAPEFWARNRSLYSSDFATFVEAELIEAGDDASDDSAREGEA
jgi:hypothetical protein